MPNTKTICILYGFCEGRYVGRHFEQLLTEQGWTVTRDPNQAQVILGHSGGCFLVPASCQAKRIIQVGIPYWPHRSLAESIGRKVVSDLRSHHHEGMARFWLRKTFWNLFYFWKMRANIRMLRGRAAGTLWRFGHITTVVRPTQDTFCTPELENLPFATKPKVIKVRGHHDDLWRHPTQYLDLL